MPARNMFFTFDTKVKINKTTVAQFVEEYRYEIEENFKDIKEAFNADSIDTNFLKELIKTIKSFDCTSESVHEISSPRKRVAMKLIYDLIADETKTAKEVLGIRYLYDEWDYEGTGYNDHYYYTYINDDQMIKKTVKEAEKTVKKLQALGVDAELIIK